jgi:hypothetical protein
MIWDFSSSSTKEPNANENKHAMGFQIDTTTMLNISKGTHRQILGQVMTFIPSLRRLVYYCQNENLLPNHTHMFYFNYHMLHF